MKPIARKRIVRCFNCKFVFSNRIARNKHLRNKCAHLPLTDESDSLNEIKKNFDLKFLSALKGCMST